MARYRHAIHSLIGLSALFLGALSGLYPARVASALPAGCTDLLQNGGFESGALGWQQVSAQGYDLISDFNPRTGRLGAYLAGVNDADDRIGQLVTLPAGSSSLTLRLWWYLATAETAGTFDGMTVALLRPDTSLLAELSAVDSSAPVGIWDELVLDLAPYAGQAVMLYFTAHTDATNISDFYLDDVSLIACTAAATATATLTPTASPTWTPSVIASATATATATPSPTMTASRTLEAGSTASPTATITPTALVSTRTPTSAPTGAPTAAWAHVFLPYILQADNFR